MNLNKLEKELRDFTSASHEKIDTNDLWNRVQPHIPNKKRYSWKMPLFFVAFLFITAAVGISIVSYGDKNSNFISDAGNAKEQLTQSTNDNSQIIQNTQSPNKVIPQEKVTTSTSTTNNQTIRSDQNQINPNQELNASTTNSPIKNSTNINPPISNQQILDRQNINTPIINSPITNQEITKQAITNYPIAETTIAETTRTNQPSANQLSANQPIANQPIANQPIAKTPITNQPIKTPIKNQQIKNQPIPNQQIKNQTITNQPFKTPSTNQPIKNQLIPSQPITKIQINSIPWLATPLDAGESTLSKYPKRISPYMRRQFPKLTLELGGSYLSPQKEFNLIMDEFSNQFSSRELAEEILEGWYATANVRYHLTPNWGISLGVQYGAINERSSKTLSYAETVFLQDTVIGNLVRIDGSIDPIYGDIEIDRTVTKQVSRINSYSFIQLPIELMYTQPVNRLNVELGIGIIQSIRLSASGFWHPDDQTEYDLSTDTDGYLKSRVGLGLTGRLGVGYDLTPGIGIYAHGRYMRYMSGITSANYGIEQRYAALGAELGIRFHLFN